MLSGEGQGCAGGAPRRAAPPSPAPAVTARLAAGGAVPQEGTSGHPDALSRPWRARSGRCSPGRLLCSTTARGKAAPRVALHRPPRGTRAGLAAGAAAGAGGKRRRHQRQPAPRAAAGCAPSPRSERRPQRGEPRPAAAAAPLPGRRGGGAGCRGAHAPPGAAAGAGGARRARGHSSARGRAGSRRRPALRPRPRRSRFLPGLPRAVRCAAPAEVGGWRQEEEESRAGREGPRRGSAGAVAAGAGSRGGAGSLSGRAPLSPPGELPPHPGRVSARSVFAAGGKVPDRAAAAGPAVGGAERERRGPGAGRARAEPRQVTRRWGRPASGAAVRER